MKKTQKSKNSQKKIFNVELYAVILVRQKTFFSSDYVISCDLSEKIFIQKFPMYAPKIEKKRKKSQNTQKKRFKCSNLCCNIDPIKKLYFQVISSLVVIRVKNFVFKNCPIHAP